MIGILLDAPEYCGRQLGLSLEPLHRGGLIHLRPLRRPGFGEYESPV